MTRACLEIVAPRIVQISTHPDLPYKDSFKASKMLLTVLTYLQENVVVCCSSKPLQDVFVSKWCLNDRTRRLGHYVLRMYNCYKTKWQTALFISSIMSSVNKGPNCKCNSRLKNVYVFIIHMYPGETLLFFRYWALQGHGLTIKLELYKKSEQFCIEFLVNTGI